MNFKKFKQKLRYFRNGLSDNKRLILTFVVPVLLIPAVFLVFSFNQQRQALRGEAATGEATLSLYPETGTYKKWQTFEVNILLNTGGLPVVGADISLSFDPTKLQAQLVTPGAIFQSQIVLKNEIGSGRIRLSLGSLQPFTGAGVYGTIRFLTTGVGAAVITFDPHPATKVARQGGGNILGGATGGTYTITDGATPTPTPESPTATPTTQLTPTPTTTLSRCEKECQTRNYSSGTCRISCQGSERNLGSYYCNNRRYTCCCSSGGGIPTPTPTPTGTSSTLTPTPSRRPRW